MPTGIIINAIAIFFGGLTGNLISSKLSTNFKESLNMIFGACSMGMGISTIVLMNNMPAVVFSVVLGTSIGLAVHLGNKINMVAQIMQTVVSKFTKGTCERLSQEEFSATLVTAIVLFSTSGTGIYGAMVSGMTGDHSILVAKSILDLFTAMIFACTLGLVVSAIIIPQLGIFLALFYCAEWICPLTTPAMINDFKAVGGILMLATGFRMIKVKMFPTADMIPAMILAMPISWFWTEYIAPLLV